MDSLSGKRLVIFGCGYVGTALARWSAKSGLRVTALTRNAATAATLRELGVSSVVADLAGDGWHDAIPGAPDFAVDCVSSGGGGIENYRQSYLRGMESILTWGRMRGKIGTLIYTSSTSVYAQGGGVNVDETMPTIAATERAQILIETEALLNSSHEARDRGFILRLAGIYGPDRSHLLEQVRAGEIAGVGDHHLNVIHRDDIVSAVAACLAAPPAMVGSSRVDLQACKLEYSIVSPK